MRAQLWALAAAALVLTAACAALPRPDAAGALIAQAMASAGAFDNAAQYAAAPPALRRAPAAGRPYDWLDRQHALFIPAHASALGGSALYLEWRGGGPDGVISRQRIWRFRNDAQGQAVMDFYTLKTPEPLTGGAPAALAALTEDDLIGYGPACALRLSRVKDVVIAQTPPDCVITARSGRRMRIQATVRFAKDRIDYSEAGILDDGAYAFLAPGGLDLSYRFERTP